MVNQYVYTGTPQQCTQSVTYVLVSRVGWRSSVGICKQHVCAFRKGFETFMTHSLLGAIFKNTRAQTTGGVSLICLLEMVFAPNLDNWRDRPLLAAAAWPLENWLPLTAGIPAGIQLPLTCSLDGQPYPSPHIWRSYSRISSFPHVNGVPTFLQSPDLGPPPRLWAIS